MQILMKKHLGQLAPADETAYDLLKRVAHGELVMVELKRPRNLGHHKKLFALLRAVYPSAGYPNEYALLNALKVYLGHYTVSQTKKGRPIATTKSISFAAMDQTEFAAFYDGCVEAIVEHFLPGVTSEQLRGQVEDMCGERAA